MYIVCIRVIGICTPRKELSKQGKMGKNLYKSTLAIEDGLLQKLTEEFFTSI